MIDAKKEFTAIEALALGDRFSSQKMWIGFTEDFVDDYKLEVIRRFQHPVTALLHARLANIFTPTYETLLTAIQADILQPVDDGSENLVATFRRMACNSDEQALDMAIRSLSKWRRDRDLGRFRLLFTELQAKENNEEPESLLLPLFVAALSESFLLRDHLPERQSFREAAMRFSFKVVGSDRTDSIFARMS